MRDLGWSNGWTVTPYEVDYCRKRGHPTYAIDVGPQYKGQEHVYTCEKCGYVYREDSSD